MMSNMTRRNCLALALVFGQAVLAQTITTSPDRTTSAYPVATVFLPGPQWQPLTGSLAKVGEPYPMTVVDHCPPGGERTNCGSSQGDYGRFTAEPSSFVGYGIVGAYSYSINCTVPNSNAATCTSIDFGPLSRDDDGFVITTQTDFTATTATLTLTGTEVKSYPVTLTAGATVFLGPTTPVVYGFSPASTPATTSSTPVSPNGADTKTPNATTALLMVVAALFFLL